MNSLRKSLSDYDRSTAFDLYTNGTNPIELDSSSRKNHQIFDSEFEPCQINYLS